MSIFSPQYSRRDGRTPVLGLIQAGDGGNQFNFQTLDSAVGQLDAGLSAVVGGTIPDASITTAKLAPGATIPAIVAITNTSGLGPIPATNTLLAEWTVQGIAGRPVLLEVTVTLSIQNTTGGITNPSDAVLTLRQGGAAGSVTGTLVYEPPPIVVAAAQNQQNQIAQPFSYVWTPGAAAPLRWSITGRLPSVAKNTATLHTLTGYALTFA